MVRLVQADIQYTDMIVDFRKETMSGLKRISGGVGLESADDIQRWLDGEYVPHYGKVEELVFLALNENGRMIGIADLRLESNDFISNFAGQIGYTVRPSERGKGYATEILSEVIRYAEESGMRNILVTCNEDNIASAKVIEKAGGKLEGIIPHPGFPNVRRYRFLTD